MCDEGGEPRDLRSSSSFVELEVKEHVTLLPAYLGKVGRGVTELLAGRVLHYHAVYGGVLLAFSRVRVLHRTGQIFDELPHIHIQIQYAASVFRPQVGAVMCGRVNKVGVEHIGALLLDCFNTSVTCSPLPQMSPEQQRRRLSNWCGRDFAAGEKIWFKVVRVEVTGRLLSLRGEFLEEEEERGEESESEEKTGGKSKKKKKERKKRKRQEEEEMETAAEGEGELKVKKKKRKRAVGDSA